MREIDFSKVITATPKTRDEISEDISKMSNKEYVDFLVSDQKRYKGPKYLLEYDNGKKTIGQLIGPTMRVGKLGVKNSKWFLPKTSEYVSFGARDRSLKVYKPTAKKLIYEQVLRQKIGDPYLASVMKTKHMVHKGKGGKTTKRITRYHYKSIKKTRRHHRK